MNLINSIIPRQTWEIPDLVQNGNIKTLKKLDSSVFKEYFMSRVHDTPFDFEIFENLDNETLKTIFEIIKEKEQDIFMCDPDEGGYDILVYFCEKKNVEMVEYVVKNYFLVNSSYYTFESSMSKSKSKNLGYYDGYISTLDICIKNPDLTKILLDNGFNVCYDPRICSLNNRNCKLFQRINLLKDKYEYSDIQIRNLCLDDIKKMIDIGYHRYSNDPYSELVSYLDSLITKFPDFKDYKELYDYILEKKKTSISYNRLPIEDQFEIDTNSFKHTNKVLGNIDCFEMGLSRFNRNDLLEKKFDIHKLKVLILSVCSDTIEQMNEDKNCIKQLRELYPETEIKMIQI